MSKRHRLRQLLQEPEIRKASLGASPCQTIPTGFPALDQALPGGWPTGVLTELLVDLCGIGELQLLLPALMAMNDHSSGHSNDARSGAGRSIMLIAPPYIPYAPALAHEGFDVSRFVVVHCHCQNDVFWAIEQALRSGVCSAVLAWSEGSDERPLRRLQLAAEKNACWAVLFRPAKFKKQRSPAALRIHLLATSPSKVSMDIFKNRGGRPQKVIVRTGRQKRFSAWPFRKSGSRQRLQFTAGQ